MAGTHTEHEDHGWTRVIPDHPPRVDTPAFVKARAKMHELAPGTIAEAFYGPSQHAQAHHGGSLIVFDSDDPSKPAVFLKNLAGIEYSAQYGADPARVDLLRQNARLLYAMFPRSADALGIRALLDTPITDAAGVGAYVDSPLNAIVPLPAAIHTGVKPEAHQAGCHHFPAPIQEIPLFAYADLQVFVADAQGHAMAVTPVAPRGSGDGRVQVEWADPAGVHTMALQSAHTAGDRYILPADHPAALKAFERQG